MKVVLPILTAGLFLPGILSAAGPVPRMVKDINIAPSLASGYPEGFATLGDRFYFRASTDQTGSELWSSDGTAAGTQLVKDVWPGRGEGLWSNNFALVSFGGQLYFVASDGEHGRELWRTDGTAAGTVMVKDVRAGSGGSFPESPGRPVAAGATLFFSADDGTTGQELFKTDGTAAGTVLVKDINPGPGGSIGNVPVVDMGGFVCFPAWDGTNGGELWRSDGTEAGTVLVKDILPGSGSGVNGASTSTFCVHNGILYFAAWDSSSASESRLWRSDGTAAGTWIVKPGAYIDSVRNPKYLTRYGGMLFFSAESGYDGTELWRTNGTAAGTVLVANINGTLSYSPGFNNSSNPSVLTVAGTSLYFQADDGFTGRELWVLNSPAGTPARVKDIRKGVVIYPNPPLSSDPYPVCALGAQFLFSADDGVNGRALWRTDGTEAGTVLWADPKPGPASGIDSSCRGHVYNGIAFFEADDGIYGRELWRTDGTPAGTFMLRDINDSTASSDPGHLIASGSTLYFSANDGVHGREVWKSDGTAAGTVMVKETYPGNAGWDLKMVSFAGGAAFGSWLGSTAADRNLWITDGTEAGTRVVFQGPYSHPAQLTGAGGKVLFVEPGSGIGVDLWSADAAGASRIITIPQWSADDHISTRLVSTAGGTIYMCTRDTSGWGLWRSEGAPWTTSKLKSFGENYVSALYARGETLYFAGGSAGTGTEPWRSDGTAAGTGPVADVVPGTNSSGCSDFTAAGAYIYFTAYSAETARELWRTDGTAAGTILLKDINPGPAYSYPSSLTPLGDRLVFFATDGVAGTQLWTSDGTSDGTRIVKNLGPNTQADFLALAGSRIYFKADDGVHGPQIWTSDGTGAGTFMTEPVPDLYPRNLTVVGRRLYFASSQYPAGTELWILPVIAPPVGSLTVTSASATGAVFAAAADPGAQSATAVIHYGPTTAYGQSLTLSLAGDFYPETLTVPVTGLTPGTTWHARLTITNPSGTHTGSDVTFSTITADYAAWLQTRFNTSEATATLTAPAADADRDGQTNELEYLAGTDPLLSSSVFSFSFTTSHGGILIGPVRPGIRYYLETATDLQNWTAQPPAEFASAAAVDVIALEDAPGRKFVRVRLEMAQ